MRVIIIGAGQVGVNIASRLAQEKKDVVIIDKDPSALMMASEHLDVQVMEGSGSSPEILEHAGIMDSSILLAVTDSDETNLVACAFANMLSPKTSKLARIRNDEYLNYQDIWARDLGVSLVINPEMEVVRAIYRVMQAPEAMEVSDFAQGKIKFSSVLVNESNLLKNVQLTKIRDALRVNDVLVAAIVREEKLIIPSGQDRIEKGDLVYLVCRDQDLDRIYRHMGVKSGTTRNIMIIGGGKIGVRLASFLEMKGYSIKLMEKDLALCRDLSEKLKNTVIIHGDGTERNILEEENAGSMDLVVTITGNDETNILTSLLTQKLGTEMTITRINKPQYIPLVRTIGLHHIVSPRLSAVNTILNQIRKGSVISAVAIRDDVDVMEAVINSGQKVAGKQIKDIKLPQGVLILAVLRKDDIILPSGETMLKSGDRITVLCSRQSVVPLEKILTTKMENSQ